jgi:hypothetical protein
LYAETTSLGAKKAEQPSDATIRPLKLEDINQQLVRVEVYPLPKPIPHLSNQFNSVFVQAAAEAEVAELERKAAERQRLRDEREQAAEAMIA